MKIPVHLIAAALVALFSATSHAQIMTLHGEITYSNGVWSMYQKGEPITLTLDLSTPLNNVLPATEINRARYFKPVSLVVGDEDAVAIQGVPLGIDIVNGAQSGLKISQWAGLTFLEQNFLSESSFIDNSLRYFPPDVPMNAFVDRTGSWFYPTTNSKLEWEITSYEGFGGEPPAPVSAVPEPSNYGFVAAVGLAGIALRQWWPRLRTSAVEVPA
jgi:hypothetical protein